ncbi:hypothetical protein MASR2M54_03130 [Aliarcobacter cryaerophilus]
MQEIKNSSHKEDMAFVFGKTKNYKTLDYIACWFYIGAKYIENIKTCICLAIRN